MVRSAIAAAYSMACTYMVALTPHSWLFDPEPMPPIATMVCARRIATAGSSQPCNGVQFMLWRVSGSFSATPSGSKMCVVPAPRPPYSAPFLRSFTPHSRR